MLDLRGRTELIAAEQALLHERLALRVAIDRLATGPRGIGRSRLGEIARLQRLLGLVARSHNDESQA
jgi:hypothetical protein